MNKARREKLSAIIDALSVLHDKIDEVKSEEESALQNMPESLEGSERYDAMEEAVDNLSEAMDMFDDVIDLLESAKE